MSDDDLRLFFDLDKLKDLPKLSDMLWDRNDMSKKEAEIIEPPNVDVLYLIHLQDSNGKALTNISIVVKSDRGDWSSTSNACGDVIDPGSGLAGVTLSRGKYFATFFDSKGKQLERLYTDAPLEPLEWNLAWPPEKPILVGLSAQAYVPGVPGELPPVPTRAQVCSIQHSLQGLTYHTKQFGDIPAWFYGKLSPEDKAIARQDHRDIKDTHIPIPVTEAYRQEGTLWPAELRDGYDWTQDLDTFRAVLTEAICDGFFIDVALGGDGLGSGPDYNDPVGRTYGCQWLMANLERILLSLKGDGSEERPDLTKYIIFRPGWDGVFYGWGDPAVGTTYTVPKTGLMWDRVRALLEGRPVATPTQQQLDSQQTRVKELGELFRRVLPDGYLAIEHTPGNIPCGEGGGDYAPGGLMTTFDTMMGEFATVHEDSCWQILGRMLEYYIRPADQPAHDDPNPPFYLGPGSPRGPYFYNAFEPTSGGVYEWCRGRCTLEQVEEVDRYLRDCGARFTGYSGLT